MQKEMEQTVGQLRAQLIGDKQEALLLLRHEYDDKLKLQLEESNAKLELVSGEIKRKTDEFGVLLLEKVKEAEEYEKKIEGEYIQKYKNKHTKNHFFIIENIYFFIFSN
jgi:hypothetical protein